MPQASNVVSFARPDENQPAERFRPVGVRFDPELGKSHLEFAQIASTITNRGWREVEKNCLALLNSEGMAAEVVDDLRRARDYFFALTELIDCAQARLQITLARIAPDHFSVA